MGGKPDTLADFEERPHKPFPPHCEKPLARQAPCFNPKNKIKKAHLPQSTRRELFGKTLSVRFG